MLSKSEARERATNNWPLWRLLLSDMSITYSDLDNMDPDDIAEANAALDIHIEQQKKNEKRK
ncbi:hypothetical protein HUB98_26495 [Paenibacillus barcinonensis]|uniref:Uncharacterized protein n=1 Tax=Paenibacillus barcinonensis TaxID=198119 RepID=A0A2V4W254_PAEBA|nr:hypothetical protein [Paenibacillus barcinonensis]PYE52493.1 hypothetical protein DFQ00_101431 [Paenibacillus barcinonensis]QKS54858.1 hypothetical protein HUB98_26175 [Paenibacillus barcinonensis]QKS54859.1 hypothetical protein HUB98_26495 [Paenibacillus barcinonensis]